MKTNILPPVVCPEARVLILGSLPGDVSLRLGEYYAHPQNAFWRIMGALAGALPSLPYEQRLMKLNEAGVALWDVCASAAREGALDSAIETASMQPNDFASFFATHDRIERVCFNGRTAEKLYRLKVAPGLPSSLALDYKSLPSTSPAHASMSFELKVAAWREAIAPKLRRSV